MTRDEGVAWLPDETVRARARLTAFISQVGLSSFEQMYRHSVEDVAWFTRHLLTFLQVPFHRPYTNVLDLSHGIAGPRWCVGGGLNITACLDRWAGEHPARAALAWEGEDGSSRTLTYDELALEVARCAAGLRALGLGKGDAIGIHLPMVPETAVALLACGRIGAIAVPLFSGYGPQAIATRLNDVSAKALIGCDHFFRKGKRVDSVAADLDALGECPSVRELIVLGNPPRSGTVRVTSWNDLMIRGGDDSLELTDAEDPLLILYTSGTTGKPKGVVHTHCGFPVKAAQDMAFGTDVGESDRILWVTDIGWMMGPWLLYGAMILGATAVIYDGAPDFPAPGRIWSVVSRKRVTVLGISPTLVRGQMAAGALPGSDDDLHALRVLASTGEPWNPDPWWWLFEKVGGGRIPLINYSGGTECSGGIVMSNPLLPIKPCAFSAACPGIAADVFDEHGTSVRGEVGELVIRQPWIGMARGFWNAPERYLETYWNRWPDTWVHGDWARLDQDGQWFIFGRSDDTLKISGKRIGPAEVESVLVSQDAVAEAAVIGVPDELHGSAMVAFCVLRPGSPNGHLADELARAVGQKLGRPLQPSRVVFLEALPKTRNAKVMRRIIRSAWLGQDPGDVSALENPGVLEAIRASARDR